MIGFASSYYYEYIAGSRFIRRRSEYLGKAFNYACAKHDGQLRRTNQEPYFAHCFRVAEAYAKNIPYKLFSEDVYAAALLHDVKEDCNVTNADLIAYGFTPRTVELVAGLTRYPWESRETYIARILESDDLDLLLLKLYDVEDNMQVNPFNLSGFKDWRASIERYQKTQKKLITYIGELIERDYIKMKLEK